MYNNLGGEQGKRYQGEMKYGQVTTHQGKKVDLIIKDVDGTYHKNNVARTRESMMAMRQFRMSGSQFIKKYNGNRFRTGVVGIGSLSTGTFKFRFCTVDSRSGEPVTLDRFALTFFDLDGRVARNGRGYEEVATYHAEGVETVEKSMTTHNCKKVRGGKQYCHVESAKVEVKEPRSYLNLDGEADAQKAAFTMYFKEKSCVDLDYTLNYGHRVFLFNGGCF